ncbi:type II toxin-antitoxin system VapC family toxin [Nocardia sp. NBC_00881]|uniref:type II toxin-antitoxin system VapC family toxin n=1 Tax=Nocardia sp. NBC_00881 TaxID=2975995 RepID=UPI0038677307|nr:type II toxin-antitoxin system VapC family toxin [Nocardia sp. NBC_00881]
MIVLDTNVISEPLRKAPDSQVVAWIDAQPLHALYLSAITVAELRFGIAAMPAGRRRDTLRDRVETRVLPLFAGRVLVFDMTASAAYAELMATARATGAAIGTSDGYIAATAAAAKMAVATRDTTPFRAAGVPVIDPWA